MPRKSILLKKKRRNNIEINTKKKIKKTDYEESQKEQNKE